MKGSLSTLINQVTKKVSSLVDHDYDTILVVQLCRMFLAEPILIIQRE